MISIHALREEGDDHPGLFSRGVDISIHALREEGDHGRRQDGGGAGDFYPRPPRGGRHGKEDLVAVIVQFLSTPSARRATVLQGTNRSGIVISIHALREEGDSNAVRRSSRCQNFYPRPPRGGRLMPLALVALASLFLSTPSARRATSASLPCRSPARFLSTPSARRATGSAASKTTRRTFLSTPSARRATANKRRVEGVHPISIHALREEGDSWSLMPSSESSNFYPRPPRGGRLVTSVALLTSSKFLSTPSARRATFS